jgi:hypothetical protein
MTSRPHASRRATSRYRISGSDEAYAGNWLAAAHDGSVRHLIVLALISLVAVQAAAAQITADKFKSPVNKKVAPALGTFQG